MGKDLRSFLELVKQKRPEDFLQIEEEIDTRYETTAWVENFEKVGKHPIFLFKKIKGFNHPIVSNLYGSRRSMAMAIDSTLEELLKTFTERHKHLIPYQFLESGPVRDLIFEEDAVDLSRLPITYHHEADAAPYITGGIITVLMEFGLYVGLRPVYPSIIPSCSTKFI